MNADLINTASNVVMTIIWLVYLQFFYRSYKRANRPLIVIHHAQGAGVDAACLFVNMSKEPIHVQCVVAYIKGKEGTKTCYITDYSRYTPENEGISQALREGPIQPGGYLILGTFKEILLCSGENFKSADDDSLEEYDQFQICVAVTHGPSERHIGVRRTFILKHKEQDTMLRAYSIYTEQLVSPRKRRIVRRWVEDSLNPHHIGMPQTRRTSQNLS